MKTYRLKFEGRGSRDWNGALWGVWDDDKFLGYVENQKRPIPGYAAFARTRNTVRLVGRFDTRKQAADNVAHFAQ